MIWRPNIAGDSGAGRGQFRRGLSVSIVTFIQKNLLFFASAAVVLLGFGCASNRVTMAYFESQDTPQFHQVHPVVNVTINGVSGYFIVDTGSPGPCLSMTAVRRCGIESRLSHDYARGIGGRVELMVATNVTVKLANVGFHWTEIPVLPEGAADTNQDFFGLLGYSTLVASHAVMDTKRKTITMTISNSAPWLKVTGP